jgi:hypothetical protein
VTCKVVRKGKKAPKVTCTVKAAGVSRASVRVTRAGVVYARAAGRPSNHGRLRLHSRRVARPGRYTVISVLHMRNGRTLQLRSALRL